VTDHPRDAGQIAKPCSCRRRNVSSVRSHTASSGSHFLQRFIDAHLSPHAAPSVTVRSDPTDFALSITPKNLLGALWLQVAQAVTGNLQHRECEEQTCRQWFEVSTRLEGKRKNREYCSDACRQKTYRRRKGQARRLAAEGQSVEAIAQLLDSNTATVQEWIRPAANRPKKDGASDDDV
jgi:hypothetical protein